jgi:hypothetical protein
LRSLVIANGHTGQANEAFQSTAKIIYVALLAGIPAYRPNELELKTATFHRNKMVLPR